MFSYLFNISKVKIIFKSFKTFFDAFADFDKTHKEEYQEAKDQIGDEDFYEDQGIDVKEYIGDEEESKSKTSSEISEIKKKEREKEHDTDGNTIENSEITHEVTPKNIDEGSESSAEGGEDSEENEGSESQSAEVVLPENQGIEVQFEFNLFRGIIQRSRER
jgi:hypothetical protein